MSYGPRQTSTVELNFNIRGHPPCRRRDASHYVLLNSSSRMLTKHRLQEHFTLQHVVKTKQIAVYDVSSCLIVPIIRQKPPDPACRERPGSQKREDRKDKSDAKYPIDAATQPP